MLAYPQIYPQGLEDLRCPRGVASSPCDSGGMRSVLALGEDGCPRARAYRASSLASRFHVKPSVVPSGQQKLSISPGG